MKPPPPTMEERLAAMKERILGMAQELRGRPYLTAVPSPPAGAPPPPLPFQEQAEEREPGDDQEGAEP